MKIALIGYGKMGQAIDAIATAKGHEIVLRIDANNQHLLEKEHLSQADVAIEFTTPETAYHNVLKCFEAHVPVVSGTTGWLDKLPEVQALCISQEQAFLHATNFSIGVNIFFEVNKKLAALMAGQSQYDVQMEEIHHTHKKDAPSGTALTLAEQVLASVPRKTAWSNDVSSEPAILSIISKRIDPAPGTHTITYTSAIDDITITHTAHSREGFAAGAVIAAVWLQGKTGVFTMRDVLNL
ncbi:4-hydroxy-tetrahydrodipicolinate reductase [Chitinophaga nivalis]|uniref:4-hydroxy-tetrahydrodipicolinate reductase n=1 Tax=Chitinophaga nivalis TaxID=2991709 RepID=A0ABT3IRH0_9BACT|nr:4-hydroxy-tetrahydrodipicolinate reductase [Chitinophaga nivalis]MCW3463747.1 4-hydroxy-tetrahydrodipicolinate reductase [Chitinophaga nivalis]MCW3486563.1 4-hydroxy-tetrahydrodipicolinate reductase [Chitinophaga nivalis]